MYSYRTPVWAYAGLTLQFLWGHKEHSGASGQILLTFYDFLSFYLLWKYDKNTTKRSGSTPIIVKNVFWDCLESKALLINQFLEPVNIWNHLKMAPKWSFSDLEHCRLKSVCCVVRALRSRGLLLPGNSFVKVQPWLMMLDIVWFGELRWYLQGFEKVFL